MSEYNEIPIHYRSYAANPAAGRTWDNVWSAPTADPGINEESLRCEIQTYSSATGFWLFRSFLVWDTSSIPSDAIITAAEILAYVVPTGGIRNDYGSSIALDVLYGASAYPHYPIVPADYSKSHYALIIGNAAIPTTANGEWVSIPLNANGIARIEKGTGGKTRFCIRLDRDSENNPPTSDGYIYVKLSFPTEDKQPKLVITYTSSQSLLVSTLAFTDVTKESLTMNGEITSGLATKRGFDYGAISGALASEWYEEGSFGPGAFSKEITGLTAGQEFCCKAKACE